MPTHKPTKCPMASNANDNPKSNPVAPLLAPPDAEVAGHGFGKHLGLHHDVKHRRHDGAPNDGLQASAAGFDPLRLSAACLARPDLQHFRAGYTFRVGKIRIRDHRPPQWDRVHDAEDAAGGADRDRGPEREPRPVAHDDKTREHEDNRRERAGRGSNRLHDIVFLNGGVAHRLQDRHRDHRRRDRGGKSEPGFETEVNIGRGEDQRDYDSDDDAADGQFLAHIAKRRAGTAAPGNSKTSRPLVLSAIMGPSATPRAYHSE